MNPINKMLSYFGVRLNKIRKENKIPKEFITKYNQDFFQIMKNPGKFVVYNGLRYDVGSHDKSYIDYECEFAARHLNELNPKKILDIGSYRHFIIGALSHFQITTVDIRERKPILTNETVVVGDAKKLDLPDNEFDAVLSLCTLEHIGLGRYGDELDLDADKKAFKEMVRALKPNGYLIFTTHITGAKPSIVFNAHRIYSYEMIKEFCGDLLCAEERFYSHKINGFCPLKEITEKPGVWDIYLGCWKKK